MTLNDELFIDGERTTVIEWYFPERKSVMVPLLPLPEEEDGEE